MTRKYISIGLVLLVASLLLAACGVPQEDLDTAIAERDAALARSASLETSLDELEAVCPLRDFATVSAFKDWIDLHVQPETTYLDDAFLAAVKVQEAAQADGYLMGLDLDYFEGDEGEEGTVWVTAFVGNELYAWYVEDNAEYYPLGLFK